MRVVCELVFLPFMVVGLSVCLIYVVKNLRLKVCLTVLFKYMCRLTENRSYTFQISKVENVKCTTIANHRKLGSSKKEFKRQKIESR